MITLPGDIEALAEARRERDEVLTALAEARSSVLRLASREEDLEADVENAEMDAAAARRERDEARARVKELEARIARVETNAIGLLAALDAYEDACGDGAYDYHEDHAEDVEDHAENVYTAKSGVRSALDIPAGEAAPRGAGAPDAAKGGASGVRSTIFECRCCDRVSNGYNDGSVTEPGWHDILNIDGPNAICPDCVKDPTALDSLRADGYDAHVGPARPVAR